MPQPPEDDRLQEILRKVRRLELRARGRTRDQIAGQYHSSFKGQGIDFADHRAYLPGDDIRAIDWNVTARLPEPYIRTFVEEREMTVFLVIDISPSTAFGSLRQSKRDLAAEVAAILAFSALRNQDKTGLILYGHDVEFMLPAAKGRAHVLRVLREILYRTSGAGVTRPERALAALDTGVRRRALAFLIGDFIGEPFEQKLRPLARHHEIIGLSLEDPAECSPPDVGWVCFEDAETGSSAVVDTSDRTLRDRLLKSHAEWRISVDGAFRRCGCLHTTLSTEGDPLKPLQALLDRRRRQG